MSRKVYNKKLIGLEQKTFPKNKRWQIDQDYIDLLTEQAKSSVTYLAEEAKVALEFMSKFNNEYYGAKVLKGDTTALHNTDELRKDCYTRNNISNRDSYSIRECTGRVSSIYEDIDGEIHNNLDNLCINKEYILESQDNQIEILNHKRVTEYQVWLKEQSSTPKKKKV